MKKAAVKPRNFPSDFFFGTSTAAAQIETASSHNWRGVHSKDGHVFNRTTDHEKRRDEDVELISTFGTVYRFGVDWARLQSAPMADFDPIVVSEYLDFMEKLKARGMRLMFVLHHFTNPLWFEEKGAWTNAENLPAFLDYAQKCMRYFGGLVDYWNTFNEPNVYALNGYLTGNFPPFRKHKMAQANRVLKHMGEAHDTLFASLKKQFPNAPIGISFNTCYFKGKNLLGRIPAAIMDWWFHRKAARHFERVDFWGLSYYACVLFDPAPITEIDRPGKLAELGLPHDKMWGYLPQALGHNIRRFYKKYKKPIIITENGICTHDPQQRIEAIKDYLSEVHECIEEGIPMLGYIFWSTFDNFEWNLGPTYQFGLVEVDMQTKGRTMTAAGEYYAEVARRKEVF